MPRRALNGKNPFDLPPNTILLRPEARAESSQGARRRRGGKRGQGRAVPPTTIDGRSRRPKDLSIPPSFRPKHHRRRQGWVLDRLRLRVNAGRVRSLFSRGQGVLCSIGLASAGAGEAADGLRVVVAEAVQARAGVRGARRPRLPDLLHGERGGGAVRALQEAQLLHLQRRPHPQGGVPARPLPDQQRAEPVRRQGVRPLRSEAQRGDRVRGVRALAQHLPPQSA